MRARHSSASEGSAAASDRLECEYYNNGGCGGTGDCPRTQVCSRKPRGSDNRPSCIAIWRNSTEGQVEILYQGCLLVQYAPPYSDLRCSGDGNDDDDDECTANAPPRDGRNGSALFTCCCHKPRCNRRLGYNLVPPVSVKSSPLTGVVTNAGTNRPLIPAPSTESGLLLAILPTCVLMLVIVFAYWMYRRNRAKRRRSGADYEHEGRTNYFISSPFVRLKALDLPQGALLVDSIKLHQIISRGRYGCVWKAELRQTPPSTVAVKIFSHNDADSWIREQQIYATTGLRDHPNILRFIGASVLGNGKHAEYWLVSAYHENGSLHGFLKHKQLTLAAALRMATGVLGGLAFLHEEDQEKLSIAHRDLKSKNILVKNDFTACIADFGLALKCSDGHSFDEDIHTQVGTSRYMAPEVLQGATEFSAPSFRRIDVYACALILWEIISRTSFTEEPVDQYRLPFEDVVASVGGGPRTVKSLQDLVVVQKRRPVLKQSWYEHAHGKVICSTIEEMWDADAEARLSACCALARLANLQSQSQSQPESLVVVDTTPLITDYNSNDVPASALVGGHHHTQLAECA